ncbi:MAG TPA: PP2C family protein-serine/threonine phosphatase [Terriglobales bacterium]|nr:PP2C family protein-serine/threonine phosphatase [Terriglobales bacterium]
MRNPQDPWKHAPLRAKGLFFAGVFFLFSSIGFIDDVLAMGRQPVLRLALAVGMSGGFAVLYALSGFRLRGRFWMVAAPVFVTQFLLTNVLARRLPSATPPSQMNAAAIAATASRLQLDGVGVVAVMVLAYVSFLYFAITEGRRHFRVQAEMELAAEIHKGLVPPVEAQIGGWEFYGRSQPSGEVGGDLVDVVEGQHGWVAYIADVSGHGVAPGVVMGMVKSAARMQLTSGGSSAELLPRLNTVLYPLKKPNMFVTLAYLAGSEQGWEYSLAGHPPILHYHAASGQITELECPNLPVGILEHSPFDVGSLQGEPGDVFVLITDGLLEVENRAGEEFGLAGVKAALAGHAPESLERIWTAITAAALRHGKPADDQSLLLVRRSA